MNEKTIRSPRHPEELRQKIEAIAGEPEGFAKAMLKADYPISTIYNAVDWMVKHGMIFRATINSTTVRFFTTPEAAKIYELANKKPPKTIEAKSKGQSFAKGAKTVYAPNYKHSVHLMPPPRTQAVTFGFVHDGLGAM